MRELNVKRDERALMMSICGVLFLLGSAAYLALPLLNPAPAKPAYHPGYCWDGPPVGQTWEHDRSQHLYFPCIFDNTVVSL